MSKAICQVIKKKVKVEVQEELKQQTVKKLELLILVNKNQPGKKNYKKKNFIKKKKEFKENFFIKNTEQKQKKIY